jgi:NAD(P)-dependent dehydrogenase (short-subunit alcohol dehydrogenase family)
MTRPVALVTGASAGIGRATARAFAQRGFDVAGGSRTAERLAAVAEEVTAAGVGFLPVVGNVREPDTARVAVAAVEARFGRLDVLVNNAGGGFPSAAADLSDGGWRAIVGATLDGPWWFSRAAYQRLKASGGVIVNVASIAGLRPSPRMTAYAVAKAGLIALTRALGAEWAPDVRVVAVALGTVATEGLVEVLQPAGVAASVRRIPMGRLGRPDEIAELICLLASPVASFVTGTTLVVDGGQSTDVRVGP